ncbi:MAG TPA: ABC transporter permease [Thermoplasmata archaeon]|jgi:peptide/nickel transport system permease protein
MADLVSYVIRKVLLAIPVVFLATLIVFLLVYLTGDPIVALAPPHAGPAEYAALRAKYGFDRPVVVQYGIFLWNLVHGDLGISVGRNSLNLDVGALILQKLPNTLELMAIGLTISYAIGIPLGVLSALRQNSLLDRAVMVFTLIAYSMPSFWLGILFMMLFAVQLRWLPAEGTVGGFGSIILPAMTLGIGNAALTTRMMRSSMLEVIRQDYITQLRSRGLPEREVIFKHALKNAILPVITVIGLDIGWFVAGAVVVETVFSWPGIGMLITGAIANHDFPLVRGCVLVLAIFVILGSLMADLAYAYVDPRVRLG